MTKLQASAGAAIPAIRSRGERGSVLRLVPAAGVIALTLHGAAAMAQVPQAPPQPGPPPNPAAAIQAKQASLLEQCPAPVTPPDAATLPINVLHWGSAGPRVLIIHGGVQGGLGGGPSTFAKQQPLASQGWRLELVERPGFGQSPSRGPEDMEADAAWIAEMLGDGANLIGHSWGGAEAMLAAARRPDAVRSLILIEPALQALLFGSPRIGADPALRASADAFGGIIMKARTPADYALGFGSMLGAVDPDNAGSTAMGGLQGDPERAARFGCSLLRARMAPPPAMRAAAARIKEAGIPVLVITGGWSPLFDAVGDLAAELTGGRHVVIASPNHFVQLSSAAEVNPAIDSFMRAASARSRPAPAP